MTLHLYRVEPFIGTKYQLLSTILVFFDRWKREAPEYREVFADIYDHLRQTVRKYEDVELLEYEVYLRSL